ncbi:MAG: thermonuclease family protein, partial [bacterium]|nr:thermonuclease family protein [bacterium]
TLKDRNNCDEITRVEKGRGITVSEIVSVYDGDTFKVNVDWWPDIIGNAISIRVNGLDTPEIRGSSPLEKQAAYVVRDYVKELLTTATSVKLEDDDDGRIDENNRDKYFRIDAEVYVDGISLNKLLIKKGYAKPYDGGTKSPWTDAELIRIINSVGGDPVGM